MPHSSAVGPICQHLRGCRLHRAPNATTVLPMDNLTPELFRTLAWYNEQVNTAMAAVLNSSEAARERAHAAGTTYFGSVVDMLNHVAASDGRWLVRMWPQTQIPVADVPSTNDLAIWTAARKRMDARIIAVCAGLQSADLSLVITYKGHDGDEVSQPRWQCLLHMFNHETHHRGQVAQVLDAAGIPNDYSNLVRYLRAR